MFLRVIPRARSGQEASFFGVDFCAISEITNCDCHRAYSAVAKPRRLLYAADRSGDMTETDFSSHPPAAGKKEDHKFQVRISLSIRGVLTASSLDANSSNS